MVDAFVYNMTDTWNNAGTTFNGIKMVVTDTASAAASVHTYLVRDDGTTNATSPILRLSHTTSGTPAIGIGASLDFEVETSSSNNEIGAVIEAKTTAVGAAAEEFDLIFKTMTAGATAAESLRLLSEGGMNVNKFAAALYSHIAKFKNGGSDRFTIADSFVALDMANPTLQFSNTNATINWAGGPKLTDESSASALGLYSGVSTSTPMTFRVYNVRTDSSNYERGVLDWTTTANTLTIGAQAAGTGTQRSVDCLFGTRYWNWMLGATNIASFDGTNTTLQLSSNWPIGWSSSNNSKGTIDAGLWRTANSVILFTGTPATPSANGWIQWGGQKRVTSDVSATSNTTLANITGLSVDVQAGRTYTFEAQLPFTCAAAGGIKAAIAGTATATDIRYNGYIIDSGANGIKGNTQASALATTVASATTTGTDGIVQIYGTITVNAAGTLTVQHAQNTSNGTATVIKRGAYFTVHDIA